MLSILVWGTGSLAESFYDEFNEDNARIIGFVESKKSRENWKNLPVYEICKVKEISYDYLIVASSYVRDIRKLCLQYQLPLDKIVWLNGNGMDSEIVCNLDIISKDIPRFEKYCREKRILVPCSTEGDMCSRFEENYYYDYVRVKTLELVVPHITDDMLGDVAELGVFRGEFAKYINYCFPDRKLYLFDTFEGFDETEANKELDSGHCDEKFVEYFKNTTVDLVLQKMTYKDNCIIKKGLFPDSLEGLDTKFVFVSIDVDFEKSIYEGLKYFYPRLVEGGYIFIHDYNHKELKGVKIAVEQYEKEFGKVKKVPLADECGSLVICK